MEDVNILYGIIVLAVVGLLALKFYKQEKDED